MVYHTKTPCPACGQPLDRIRPVKRQRERGWTTYDACPTCGWSNGQAPSTSGSRRGGRSATFRSVGGPLIPEVVAEMARYAHAEGYRLSADGQRVTLLGRGATGRNVIERAASFGWTVDRQPVLDGPIHVTGAPSTMEHQAKE